MITWGTCGTDRASCLRSGGWCGPENVALLPVLMLYQLPQHPHPQLPQFLATNQVLSAEPWTPAALPGRPVWRLHNGVGSSLSAWVPAAPWVLICPCPCLYSTYWVLPQLLTQHNARCSGKSVALISPSTCIAPCGLSTTPQALFHSTPSASAFLT